MAARPQSAVRICVGSTRYAQVACPSFGGRGPETMQSIACYTQATMGRATKVRLVMLQKIRLVVRSVSPAVKLGETTESRLICPLWRADSGCDRKFFKLFSTELVRSYMRTRINGCKQNLFTEIGLKLDEILISCVAPQAVLDDFPKSLQKLTLYIPLGDASMGPG